MFDFLIAFAQTINNQQYTLLTTIPFYLLFIILMIMSMPGIGQRFQIWIMARDVEQGLYRIEKFLNDAKSQTEKLLKENGAKDPKGVVNRLSEMLLIEPVNIEPTDIIPRLRLLLRSSEDKVRLILSQNVQNIDPVLRSKLEVSAEIVNTLNLLYKIIRHYLLQAKKLNSVLILYQLQMVVPIYVKIAEAYAKAQNAFLKGVPVGDSLGPLVASRFLLNAKRKWSPSRDTVAGEVEFEGRKIIVIKAEGPMATVGTPGEAVENVIEEYGGKVSRIITVDAAAKLEGEDTGEIAEGTGVAMGDPGPEKIAIERVAVKYNLPIDAVVVKMGIDEAITEMKKEIYQAGEKVVDVVKNIILERTKPGDVVVLVGVGNTVGVAQ
ncbi:MAG: DUF1512 domain-containing protein [Sulfolobaceae archaeon]|nr:DUF1512 domain-containing protein [Sulfolobaceae archaeon]